MSGIVGVVHLDGRLVHAEQVSRLAEAMRFRGPDCVQARGYGPAGLGIALLRTTRESEREDGLATLDGEVWIAADARIDGRGALVSALTAAGRHVDGSSTDPELILHAYSAWGESLVERLIGDFAFAVWDGPRQRLVCARDHFGVKPFFHARTGSALVFGNTVDAILPHPGVSAQPSEASLADFLAHGYDPDPSSTPFVSIRALPPAHVLVAEGGAIRIRRYWALPVDGELRYARPEEYAEHFRAVLGDAVRDRLRVDRAAILLSGGTDSTAVAAVAVDAGGSPAGGPTVYAFTGVGEPLIADGEGRYAAIAAEALGIPIRYRSIDGYAPFERWGTPGLRTPEPSDDPLLAFTADHLSSIAAGFRVGLTGEGGDATLRESASRLARLVAGGRVWTAAREAAEYARIHRRFPRPGLRTLLRGRSPADETVEIPRWLRQDAAAGVRERAARRSASRETGRTAHPLRPEAYRHLSHPFWPAYLYRYDPGFTRVPVELGHPLLDVRVAAFALSVPPAQWYNDKGVVRLAMRGRLPREIVERRKSPLAGDPLRALRARGGEGWLGERTVGSEVEGLVDASRVPRDAGGAGESPSRDLTADLRPLCLTLWMRGGHS
ncbi:MAG: asparagine synthase [Gemmatimonadetes bacterium]|nr:asparagine synthase [Gemmatimonadota bacterium]